MTFATFTAAVDARMIARFGFGVNDIPTDGIEDFYAAGMAPDTAAEIIFTNAM